MERGKESFSFILSFFFADPQFSEENGVGEWMTEEKHAKKSGKNGTIAKKSVVIAGFAPDLERHDTGVEGGVESRKEKEKVRKSNRYVWRSEGGYCISIVTVWAGCGSGSGWEFWRSGVAQQRLGCLLFTHWSV